MRGSRSVIGDTRVAQNGYHYTRTKDGWKLTHHVIAESRMSRAVRGDERVVFVDRDRTNLDPSNISVQKKITGSLRKKEANLIARIQELQGQLEEVRRQIKDKMEAGDNE
jgi:hypothetical protein